MRAAALSPAPFTVRRLTPKLGAEISGIDLAQGVSPDVFRALSREISCGSRLKLPSACAITSYVLPR